MNTVNVRNCPYDLSPDTLKTGSIFGALSPSAIEFMVSRGTLKHYTTGEKVFNDGEKGDSFYIVIDGKVSFYRDDSSETSSLIRQISFGETIGYVTMISLTPRLGYAIAEAESLLLEIDYNVFGELHDRYAFDFGILILNLSRDMARNIQKLAHTLSKAGISVDLTK